MAWPTTLPQKLRLFTFNEGLQNGAVRTSMDAGEDFVRQRFTAALEFHSGDMVMTTAQLAILKTFYRTTTLQGSQWFDWLHQVTGVAAEYRFLAPPSIRPMSGDKWQVEMSFEVRP